MRVTNGGGWRGRVVRLALVLVTGPGVARCGIREDESDCEEAAARLARCCGVSLPGGFCEYTADVGGDGALAEHPPVLSVADSRCILARRCEALAPTGVCASARTRVLLPRDAPGGTWLCR